MSSQTRFTDEFKREAVRQVTEGGHTLSDVARRLGVSTWSLMRWKKRFAAPPDVPTVAAPEPDVANELARLRAELRRVTEERDILKKATAYFAKQSG
jgi:transposase